MKICVLKESLCLGGTERSAANISRALSKEHCVYTALYDGSQIKYAYGGRMVDFNQPAQRGLLYKIKNNVIRNWKYNKLIRSENIEILFEFISINNPLSALKRNPIRIISSRDFSVLSTCIERFTKCLENADAMVCNSQFLRDYYISHYPQYKNRVYTVYNIIDVDGILMQAQESTDALFEDFIMQHPKTVVSVGRFCKEKGFEYLIDAFAQARQINKDLGLVLVGDGDFKQIYTQRIACLGLEDHVYFTGFQDNPYKYMARCTCFVLSSLTEGFPNVLAEAMALELPVIAANCYSGPAEILRKDGDYMAVSDKFIECDYGIITPRITEKDNAKALSQLALAINELLGNKNKAAYYAKMSQQRARDFSEEAAVNQLNKIFEELKQKRCNV